MSGKTGTGELAHEWAHLLKYEIAVSAEHGLPVVFRCAAEPAPYVRKLMSALGVPVEVVPVSVATGVPLYCPHRDCGWSFDRGGKRGEGFLETHLRVVHRGVDPRSAKLTAPTTVDGSAVADRPAGKTWSRKAVSREDAIRLFREAVEELGRVPRMEEWRKLHRRPSFTVLRRYFGNTWAEVVRGCGLEPPVSPADPKIWTAGMITEAVELFRREHGRGPFTTECLEKNGLPGVNAVKRVYGSWAEAAKALDLPAARPGRPFSRTALSGREPQGREETASPDSPPASPDARAQDAVGNGSPGPASTEVGSRPENAVPSSVVSLLATMCEQDELEQMRARALAAAEQLEQQAKLKRGEAAICTFALEEQAAT